VRETDNFFSIARELLVGQGLLIFEASRSHSDEQTTCRTGIYLHSTHKRQKSMPPAGFEYAVPACHWPQTHALGRAANGFDTHKNTHTRVCARAYISNFVLKHCQTLRFCIIGDRYKKQDYEKGHCWNDTGKGKIDGLGKTCLIATLSTTNTHEDAPGNEFQPSAVRRRPITPRYAALSSNR
jgi:hypothetical protein